MTLPRLAWNLLVLAAIVALGIGAILDGDGWTWAARVDERALLSCRCSGSSSNGPIMGDLTTAGESDERAIVLVIKGSADEASDVTERILDLLDGDVLVAYTWPADEVLLKPCPTSGPPPSLDEGDG